MWDQIVLDGVKKPLFPKRRAGVRVTVSFEYIPCILPPVPCNLLNALAIGWTGLPDPNRFIASLRAGSSVCGGDLQPSHAVVNAADRVFC